MLNEIPFWPADTDEMDKICGLNHVHPSGNGPVIISVLLEKEVMSIDLKETFLCFLQAMYLFSGPGHIRCQSPKFLFGDKAIENAVGHQLQSTLE